MNSPSTVSCPGCGAEMREVAEPDVSFEACSRCGGIYLDREELNVLATGLAGDIEYSSVELNQEYADRFPTRPCPKCPGHDMKKEDLLIYSELIFDHCTNCGGWFLDRGELKKMNAILSEQRRSQGGGREFRGERGGYWVTVTEDHTYEIAVMDPFGVAAEAVPVAWRKIEVRYPAPLGVGLTLSPEIWGRRLWKLFGFSDLETADPEFDREFLIRGVDAEGTLRVLTPPARAAILAFIRSPLASTGKKRTLEMLDDRVVFTYSDQGEAGTSADQEERLILALVEMLEASGICAAG